MGFLFPARARRLRRCSRVSCPQWDWWSLILYEFAIVLLCCYCAPQPCALLHASLLHAISGAYMCLLEVSAAVFTLYVSFPCCCTEGLCPAYLLCCSYMLCMGRLHVSCWAVAVVPWSRIGSSCGVLHAAFGICRLCCWPWLLLCCGVRPLLGMLSVCSAWACDAALPCMAR
jgi:hypothetical protein